MSFYNSELNKKSEAIRFSERLLGILEKLYEDNPLVWTVNYIESLATLADYYAENNRLKEAIKLSEKALDILEKLNKDDPSKWEINYVEAIDNLKLIKAQNNWWNFWFKMILGNN